MTTTSEKTLDNTSTRRVFNEPTPVEIVLRGYIAALDDLITEAANTKAEFVKDLKKMDLAQALRGTRAEMLKESGYIFRIASHIKEQIFEEKPCTSEQGYQFMDNRAKMLENNMKNTASNMACRDRGINDDAIDMYRAYQRILCRLSGPHYHLYEYLYESEDSQTA